MCLAFHIARKKKKTQSLIQSICSVEVGEHAHTEEKRTQHTHTQSSAKASIYICFAPLEEDKSNLTANEDTHTTIAKAAIERQ